MESSVAWVMAACSPLKVNRRFGRACRIDFCQHHAGLLLGLLFILEDGGHRLLRNFGWPLTDDMASRSRRQNSSCPPLREPQIPSVSYCHLLPRWCKPTFPSV
jgi:hypothetical protein